MDDPKAKFLEPQRGILRVDATRRRQMRAILEFVRDVHHHIDPDQFRVDAERVRAVLQALEGEGVEETRIAVTHADLLFLEIAIDAADTYSHRRSFHAVEGIDDDDFVDLLAWLTREEGALFRQPPTVH